MISAKSLHVAYIEDEPVLRELFFHQYKHLFASIDLYAQPREALKLISENPVDLLFCDVWMPDISGIEVYQEFRKSFPHTPFIFISGDLNLLEKVKDVDQTQLYFLPKPCRIKVMTDFLLTLGATPQE